MNNKTKYRELCSNEITIPIFSRDWWLDTVSEGLGQWDVALVEKGGEIVASMPYFYMKKSGFTYLTHPPLTQTLGPWLRKSKAKYAKSLAQQKDLMQELIEQLPKHDSFQQSWHYSISNWLPFYWKGYKQSTNYTYVLDNLGDKDELWDNLLVGIRTDIRKAGERYKLTVKNDASFDDFLYLNKMVFSRQNRKSSYSDSLVERLDAACKKRNCRKIFIAEDSEGKQHAGVYVIWDENSAYYLMGGGNPELRNSGATSLCLWEAIQYCSGVTKRFDFEGSMVEPIERFFRSFGANQVPYFSVYKTPSRVIKTLRCLKDIVRR